MYYKENGEHKFLHTKYARTFRSDQERADDPSYWEKHWLITVNGVGEHAVTTGYVSDEVVFRLIRKYIPGATSVVFLHECKPLTLREKVDIWLAHNKLLSQEK
jgi:hypothetical protein